MTRLEDLYKHFLECTWVETDTRKISKGSIFFALKGANFNGNAFALKAIELGASVAVVDEDVAPGNPQILRVEDSLKTLQELARLHRRRFNIPLLAVTGSNGKTTTKELLLSVLKVKFHAHATAGNLNNHIGVPLTLLQLKPEHEIAIIEMGANHQGEIEMLCSIAEPDYGIVTNIGKAHLEGFGGVEGVIKAKSEMFDFIKKRNGKLFVNADDSLLMEKSEQGKRILYGTTQESHLRGRKEKSLPELSFSFTWKREETLIKSKTVQSHLSGDFHMSNLLCAAAVGAYFGLSADEIKSGIESYQPKNQRSQWVEIGSTKILLDTYNANPGSVSAAIKLLNELPNDGKKLAVLGDMFELGKDSRDEHLAILKQISSSVEISALVLGEEFFNAYQEQPDAFKNILPFRDREALFDYIKKTDRENLTVLLKGSRGMKMEDFLAAFH